MTEQPKGSGTDLIGDFQRWLVRSSARSVSRGVGDQIRSTLQGGQPRSRRDVWETATAPPPTEAPECAWCPVCRAARMMSGSRPGLGANLAAASGALANAVQEAVSAVEAAIAAANRAAEEARATERTGAAEQPAAESETGPAYKTGDDSGDNPAKAAPPGGSLHEPDDRG